VFADLGFANAAELQTKVRLAHEINLIIDRGRLTQMAAAKLLGIGQPKVSALVNYKLDGFSIERLMGMLNSLDHDIEIVIKRKPRSRSEAHISVRAA
jgi:predicted XRE-type DNA-binding protein